MTPAELLSECHGRGIVLAVGPDGGLVVDAPRDGLPPELVDLLRQHKAAVLDLLRGDPEADPFADWVLRADASGRWGYESSELPEASRWWAREPWDGIDFPIASEAPATWRCPCGSTGWRDRAIHAGQSIRRDCRRCGRFVAFTVWYRRPCDN